MTARILIAGVVAGVLVFVTGAIEHMVFGWGGRTITGVSEESTYIEFLKGRNLKPGLYNFPAVTADVPAADQAKVYAELNERYKAGPSGLLLIAPTGEDMMGPKTLGLELATNVLAGLIAAWIVSLLAADVGIIRRWLAVALLGVFAWLSLTASYGIWYRFPHAFIHDELYCALLEWSVAGLSIAAIVRRSPPAVVK